MGEGIERVLVAEMALGVRMVLVVTAVHGCVANHEHSRVNPISKELSSSKRLFPPVL
jgi:hypothetical protein